MASDIEAQLLKSNEIIQNQNIEIKNQNEQIIKLNQTILSLSEKVGDLTGKLDQFKQWYHTKKKIKRNVESNFGSHPAKIQKGNDDAIPSDGIQNDDIELLINTDNEFEIEMGEHNHTEKSTNQTRVHKREQTVDIANNKWSDIVMSDEKSKTEKTTPIQIGEYSHEKYAELINGLFEKFGGIGYKWVQLKGNSQPRINSMDIKTKGAIVEYLRENKWEFNTYGEKNQKRKAFIVRGFGYGDDNVNIAGINEALSTAGYSNVETTRFTTGFQKRNPNLIVNKLYRIILPADADEVNLLKIRTINSFGIRIEKMKNDKVIQCKRCQRFSHTANQCSFLYRCVQCINSHQPGCCPRTVNSKLPLGCINCATNKLNHHGHTANNLELCEFYKTTLGKNKKKNVHSSENADVIHKKQNQNNFYGAFQNVDDVKSNQPVQSKKKNKNMIKKYRQNVSSGSIAGSNGKSNGNSSNLNNSKKFTNKNGDALIAMIRELNKTLLAFANGSC